jgi:hypothetical protein
VTKCPVSKVHLEHEEDVGPIYPVEFHTCNVNTDLLFHLRAVCLPSFRGQQRIWERELVLQSGMQASLKYANRARNIKNRLRKGGMIPGERRQKFKLRKVQEREFLLHS